MDYAGIIKERIHTREFLEAHGFKVGRGGMMCCPIHGEKTPSMKVYDDIRRGWYCFGCHRGGDVIDLAKVLWGVGFKDAMRRLNDDFSLNPPFDRDAGRERRRNLAMEIEAARKKRDEQMAKERRAEKAYWDAYDRWMNNERIIAERAPKSPDEAESEEFAYALTHRTEISLAVDDAQDRWMEVRRGRYHTAAQLDKG